MSERPMYYRLDEAHNVVPATRDEMIALFEGRDLRLVAHEVVRDAEVSTVFLVHDQAMGAGPPLVFETMIFGGRFDQHRWLYATWDEAVAGHQRIADALRAGTEP